MITGIDYIYFSNVSILKIKDTFIHNLSKIGWLNPFVRIIDNEPGKYYTFFVSKNKEMFNKHDELGFVLDKNEEACIYIAAELCNQKLRISTHEYINEEGFRVSDTSNAFVIFTEYWLYTLVLPTKIEDHKFSNNIHSILCDLLHSPPQLV